MTAMEKERFNIVKSMDTIVKSLNDEEAYYHHWIYLVPDEASDDEFEYIAKNAKLFSETVRLFLLLMKVYGDSGMYITGSLYAPSNDEIITEDDC